MDIICKLPLHPNIAYYEECYTFSTFAGEYDFAVLQYYEEGNLQQLLTDKQLSFKQKDNILRQILEGVAFLHSQGIIHRDLKPQNILIANRNGEYIPKITDFGISKKLDTNKSSIYTNSLAGAGTLSYASPEQLMGNTIRKNTDLWSFGVIACWLFTGKLPFNTGNQTVTSESGRIELFKQITSGDISAVIKQLPSTWQKLVKQCIIVDSSRRIGNAALCLNFFGHKTTVDTIIGSKKESSKSKINTRSSDYNIDNTVINNKNNFPGSINNLKRTKYIVLGILFTIILILLSTSNQMKPNKVTVTDIDGNIYHTVTIGNQTWMIENLNTTRFCNGEEILKVNDETQWWKLASPAYYNYTNKLQNGRIYNWYAVVDSRKIAPSGWHIATDEDYNILENNMTSYGLNYDMSESENRYIITIGKIYNTFRSLFISPIGNNRTHPNSYNFIRMSYCLICPRLEELDEYITTGRYRLGHSYGWWSSSNESNGYYVLTDLSNGSFHLHSDQYAKSDGLSVRCVKDN